MYESFLHANRRSNNSFVLLKNNRFAQIDKFLLDEETMQELTICNLVKSRNGFTRHYHMLQIIEEIERDTTIVPTSDIKTICIVMDVLGSRYLIALPNLLHY